MRFYLRNNFFKYIFPIVINTILLAFLKHSDALFWHSYFKFIWVRIRLYFQEFFCLWHIKCIILLNFDIFILLFFIISISNRQQLSKAYFFFVFYYYHNFTWSFNLFMLFINLLFLFNIQYCSSNPYHILFQIFLILFIWIVYSLAFNFMEWRLIFYWLSHSLLS